MKPLRDLLGFDPGELRGARVTGEVPVSDALINRLVADLLAARPSPVAALVVEQHDADTVIAHVRMRTAIVPPLKIHLQIAKQPEFPDAPVLVLRWSMGALGRLARLASPAVALFNLLPPGIRVDGDLIGVDVAEVLRSRGFGELVPYIARLRVSTQSGRVIVGFEVRNRS